MSDAGLTPTQKAQLANAKMADAKKAADLRATLIPADPDAIGGV